MPTWWPDIEFVNLNVIELQPCRARAPDRLRCGAGIGSREMVRMVQAKGAGYAMSKQQELETMQCVAHATGALLLIRCSQLMMAIHAAKCFGDTRTPKTTAGDKVIRACRRDSGPGVLGQSLPHSHGRDEAAARAVERQESAFSAYWRLIWHVRQGVSAAAHVTEDGHS